MPHITFKQKQDIAHHMTIILAAQKHFFSRAWVIWKHFWAGCPVENHSLPCEANQLSMPKLIMTLRTGKAANEQCRMQHTC